jgi:hypothetical protein
MEALPNILQFPVPQSRSPVAGQFGFTCPCNAHDGSGIMVSWQRRMRMKYLTILLGLALAATAQTVPKPCAKGEYLTVDGRCLHDRTGESSPAGDGCNTMTCWDPSCRSTSVTALYCRNMNIAPLDGTRSEIITMLPGFALPKIKCSRKLEGTTKIRKGITYQCVRKIPKN